MATHTIKLPDLGPMHEAVGWGISSFASVEFGVGMAFASMMEPAPRGYSVAALHAARSFEAKMKIVDAVAYVALKGDLLARWRNLSCKITKRKDFRDRLAHWTVTLHPGANSYEEIKKMKPALVPPFWAKEHGPVMWGDHNGPVRPIHMHQMKEFQTKCGELTMALINLSTDIQGSKNDAENGA